MDQDIKRNWRETRMNPDFDDYDQILNGRRRTALENLSRRYRWFSNIGLICAFWAPLAMTHYVDEGKIVITLATAIYFLLCSSLDRWFYHGIKSIDCSVMTVSEVLNKALYYRKRHLQSIMFLLPLAILLIGIIAYYSNVDSYFYYGVGFGGITGLAIGFRQLLKFLADYRNITLD